MQENENISIEITGDITDIITSNETVLMSFEQTDSVVTDLLKKIQELRSLLSENVGSEVFNNDLETQLSFTERNVNRLLNMRKNIDKTLGKESKTTETALFNQMVNYTQKRVSDLSASINILSTMHNNVDNGSYDVLDKVMKKTYVPLRKALESYTKAASSALGTQSADSIIDMFMGTKAYKGIISQNITDETSKRTLTSSNMRQYLKAMAATAIPQIMNNNYVDWEGERRSVHNIQELLPSTFSNIRLGRNITSDRSSNREDFSKKLTASEMNVIKQLVLENQYISREAEKAGLISRKNGTLYVNKDSTRGNVNAFAGEIAHLFSVGAMGLPMYGIKDIYDPKRLKDMAIKTNKDISYARDIADILDSQFGEWIDPGYYESVPKPNKWTRAGSIKATGRQDRMQFLEILPENIGQNGVISIEEQDKHWTPVIKSSYQSYLSKQKGATPFVHNGVNDNEIFVKLPNEEYQEASYKKDEEQKKRIENEVVKALGSHIVHNGIGYTMSGLTGTHIAYTRDDLFKAISDPSNPDRDFFYNGESARDFKTYQDFAKAVTYRKLLRTEGEDLSEVYGLDQSKIRVLVADLKSLSGSDGQNIMSRKFLSEGFQGRSYGGKATFSPVSFDWLKETYGDKETGLITLPGAGLGGSDLVFNPDDYDIIEDIENIKTNKAVFAGMTSEEAGRLRSEQYARYGLFGKTSYDAANTESRYISAQLANTMAFTPEAQKYFRSIYLDELAALEDPGLVIERLFSGNDALSVDVRRDNSLLNSKEAQSRINEYRDSVNYHISKGDVLLPDGEAQYAMAAGWVPDIFNNILLKSGKQLTEEQARASVGSDVLFLLNQAEKLGLARNPATFDGNVEVINKAAEDYFAKLAETMGVDRNALYVNPAAVILERLQGADLDGDTIFSYAIKHSKDKRFADIMRATLVNTAERYKKIMEATALNSEDPEEARKAVEEITRGRVRKIEYDQESFSTDNSEDMVKLWIAQQEDAAGMGVADAITRNAMRMPLTRNVATAINYATQNYNVNSTRAKKAEEYITSNEEWDALKYGAPVSYLANWAGKSFTINPDKPEVAPVFNKEKFYEDYGDRILKTNFASIHSPGDIQNILSRFYASQIKGWDVSGGVNWDEVLSEMPMEYEENSAVGGFIRRLNDLRSQQLQGKFLVWSDEVLSELDARGIDARREIEQSVDKDSSIPKEQKKNVVDQRYKSIGGEVLRHIHASGITEKNMATDESLAADVLFFIEATGADSVYAKAVDYDSMFSVENQERNKKALNQAVEKKKTLESEQEKHVANNKQLIENQRKKIEDIKSKDDYDQELLSKEEENLYKLEHPLHEQIEEVNSEINKAERYNRQVFDYYQAQGEYNRIFAGAQEFSKGLWKSRKTKEAYINEESNADAYYNKQSGIARAYNRQLDAFLEDNYMNLSEAQKDDISKLRRQIDQGVDYEFADKSIYDSKKLSEKIAKEIKVTDPRYNKTRDHLEGYEKKISEAEAFKAKLDSIYEEKPGSDPMKETIDKARKDTEQYINEAKEAYKTLRDMYGKESANSIQGMLEKMQVDNSDDPFASLFYSAKRFSEQIDDIKKKFSDGIFPEDFDKKAAFKELDKQAVIQYKKTIDSALDSIKNTYKSIGELESKYTGTYDSQNQTLDSIDQKIKEAKKQAESLRKQQGSGYGADKYVDKAYKEANETIESLKAARRNVVKGMRRESVEQFDAELYSAESQYADVIDIVESLRRKSRKETSDIDRRQQILNNKYQSGIITNKLYNDFTARNKSVRRDASFEAFSNRYVDSTSESIIQAGQKAAGTYNENTKALDSYNKTIQQHIALQKELTKLNKTESAKRIGKIIEQEQDAINKIIESNSKALTATLEEIKVGNSDDPFASLFYNAKRLAEQIDEIKNKFSDGVFPEGFDKESVFSQLDDQAVARYKKSVDSALKSVKDSYESIKELESKYDGTYDSQKQTLDSVDKKIKEADKQAQSLLQQRGPNDEVNKYILQAYEEANETVKSLKTARNNILKNMRKETANQLDSDMTSAELRLSEEKDVVALLQQKSDKEMSEINKRQQLIDARYNNGIIGQNLYHGLSSRNEDLRSRASFEAFSKQYVDTSSKSIIRAGQMAAGTYNKNKEALDAYNKTIQEHIDLRDALISRGKESEADYIQTIIENEQAAVETITAETRRETGARHSRNTDSIQASLSSRNYFNRIRQQSRDSQRQIDESMRQLNADRSSGSISRTDYQNQVRQLRQLRQEATVGRIAFTDFGDAVSRTISQFGRQMFHNAINEVKRFVKEFDSAMTEIQMVTLKTDEEIAKLGQGFIDMAIDLKTPIANVTDAATALYRQGLPDEQVDERLEEVMKFQATSGVKAEEAVKLVTVAMSGGLVDSAEQAMDVVSALGDSAATTASEITKGLTKSMYAAKTVGVTYEQLISMLTVITSKTQLGGNVAGTTLNTVFSRLARIKSGEDLYDEKGNRMSNSDAAYAIRDVVGAHVYENGVMANPFDIFIEIGKNWDNYDDGQKNRLVSAIGGTYRFSNVSALLSGFSEKDEVTGEYLIEQYMNTALGSEGTTDKKYQHYLDSLAASMTNVQNAFDGFISSMELTDVAKGFLDFVSNSIQGLTELNEAADGIPVKLALIGTALASVAALAMANPWLLAILGIAGGVMMLGNAAYQSNTNKFNPSERMVKIEERHKPAEDLLQRAREINNTRLDGRKLSDDDMAELKEIMFELEALGFLSRDASKSMEELTSSAVETAKALDGTTNAIHNSKAQQNAELVYGLIQQINHNKGRYIEAENAHKSAGTYAVTAGVRSNVWDPAKKALEDTSISNYQDNDDVYALTESLYQAGELDNVQVTANDGTKHTVYEIRVGQTSPYGIWDEVNEFLKDENIIHALRTYVNPEANKKEEWMSPFEGYGDYSKELIFNTLLELFGEENIELVNFVASEKVKEINEAYEASDYSQRQNFTVGTYLINGLIDEQTGMVTLEHTTNWAKGLGYKPTVEQNAVGDSSDTDSVLTDAQKIKKIVDATYGSDSNVFEGQYGDAYLTMYDKWRESTGKSTSDKYENFLLSSYDALPNLNAILADSKNADLSKVIGRTFVYDEGSESGYRIEIDKETFDVIGQLVGGKDIRTSALSNYRSQASVDEMALEVFGTLMNPNNLNKHAAWNNLYLTQEATQMGQQSLISKLGEDLVNLIVSGVADDETIAYAESILRYGGTQESELAYRDHAMTALFGAGYRDGLTEDEMSAAAFQYEAMMYDPLGSLQLDKIRELEGGVDLLEELSKVLDGTSDDAERCGDALQHVVDGMDASKTSDVNRYKKNLAELEKIQDGIAKGGSDAVNVLFSLNDEVLKLNNLKWATNQYAAGDKSQNVLDVLTGNFDVDSATLENASKEMMSKLAEGFRYGITDEQAQLEDEISQASTQMYLTIQDELMDMSGQQINLGSFADVNGRIDVSDLIDSIGSGSSQAATAFATWMQYLANMGAEFIVNGTPGEEGFAFDVDLTKITGGKYYGGGGGGGSKKTTGDKLIERIGYGRDLYEHQIKMVQYEQTRYENADELGNYGKMIQEEIELEQAFLPVLKDNIEVLRDEFDSVDEGSEEWYKLRDAILEAEEQYEEINNTIEENKKKLEENEQAILALHTDLEEMVVSEIELRIESEKEMLDGTVTMQDTILNAIKQRYQDEWDLIKQDIDKKKEALQEEKDLIDERLDAKKEAEDEAAKYEELTELKKQLALISMDSTRTKDAASLRESIDELEKEIGWDIAEREAENEKNAIQDQIDAYDDYVTKGDEDLSELLSDANNFAEEVNGVLKMSQSDLFNWLKENVKEYADSLDDAQKQMVQSWEATYKQMLGITDTYWDEVNAILNAKDTFLEYMKQSEEYIYASDDERKQLLYQWSDSYDKWIAAQKTNAEYEHEDPGMGDWSGNEYSDSSSSSGSGGSGGSSSQHAKDKYRIVGTDYLGNPAVRYNSDLSAAKREAADAAKSTGNMFRVYDANGNIVAQYKGNAALEMDENISPIGGSSSESGSLLKPTNKSGGHWYYKVTKDGETLATDSGFKSREQAQEEAKEAIKKHKLSGAKYSTYYYKKGGIADFTGPAWLDGTPSEPERILSADQTRSFDELVQIMDDFRNYGVSMDAIRGMMNWSTMVNVPYSLSHVGNDAYQGNSANIGDIFVTITEAQISDDRDIEELANIVGQKFVKEIGKQGFNVARYNF